MFTIMHISDLHRADVDPISNKQLMSALMVDRGKFAEGVPAICQPDALVVSGDLVQGLSTGDPNHPAALEKQYEEAAGLLTELTAIFFDGDKRKVILVPGNHDVDWTTARKAMTECDTKDAERVGKVHTLIAQVGSKYRWDWRELKLYEITNDATYRERFAQYNKFASSFYSGVLLKFEFDPTRDWNLFELDEGRIVVAAFNSCVRNDCFSKIGEISKDAIAECHMALLQGASPKALRIAVWHHNVEGPPHASDYIDPAAIRQLIDKSFAIGMHGHQHKSEVNPFTVFASGRYEMTVFSAGSLCAGSKALPQGYNPQYNLLELDIEDGSATVHVREMLEQNVFGPGRLNVPGRESYLKVKRGPRAPVYVPTFGKDGGRSVKLADEIEVLRTKKEFDLALSKLDKESSTLGGYGRKLKTAILLESEKWPALIAHLSPPLSQEEALLQIRAAIESGDLVEAQSFLDEAQKQFRLSPDAISQFSNRIATLRALRS